MEMSGVLIPYIMMKSKIPFFVTSLIIHLLLLVMVGELWPKSDLVEQKRKNIRLTMRTPQKKAMKIEEKPEEDFTGQIVDIADPEIEETPDKADYLANKARKTEKETKTEQFKINPDILSEEFTREEILKKEDLKEVQAEDHSSGAKVGNNQFRPDRDGVLASLPSKFRLTNKDGLQRPSLASSTMSQQAGAPNNDLLDEETAERLQLNAMAYPYAGYMNQIRRMVNFYWTQNLDNADGPFHKVKYQTGVTVIITKDGLLKELKIVTESGAFELDKAVVDAFSDSSPFPRPPDALLKGRNDMRLPDFLFQVNLSSARQQYRGIDPRAGVQFPGMLKAPR
jgi:hypothetical protein